MKEIDSLEDRGVGGRIILKLIQEKDGVLDWTDGD